MSDNVYAVSSRDARNTLTEATDQTKVGDLVKAEYVTLHDARNNKYVIYKDVRKVKPYLTVGPTGSIKTEADATVGSVMSLTSKPSDEKRA